jgi:hypothetical protein
MATATNIGIVTTAPAEWSPRSPRQLARRGASWQDAAMTDISSGLDALASVVDAVYPEHAASAHAPELEDDAHPAVRALWSRLRQSSSLEPGGITRGAREPEVERIFNQWSHAPAFREAWTMELESGIPYAKLPARPRWLLARESSIDFIDDASPEADPPVLRIEPSKPGIHAVGRGYFEYYVDRIAERAPVEQRAMFFYGSALDERRGAVPGLSSLAPRVHSFGPGLWTWHGPPEVVLEALGERVLFDRLGTWVDFVAALPDELRKWCYPPELPALGLERSGSPEALPVLDAIHPELAPNPAGVELTPAFPRVTRGQRVVPRMSRVGRIAGMPVWVCSRPDSEDIHIFHETADREALQAKIEALGGVIAWMEGRDLRED